MATLRTGPTYTQETLSELTNAVKVFGNSDDNPETAFKLVTQALQKFLHHGMSRFSMETLQFVLDELIEAVSKSKKEGDQEPYSLRSLTQLRAMVKATMLRREAGSLRASDANALKYIETFFYCVYCLSEAKRMFDEMYENLYFNYFDPDGISRQSTKMTSAKDKNDKSQESDDYSQFGISTLQQMTGSTHHKLRQTARDMREVLDRWGQLLTDEEVDPSSYDPESLQDLHLLHGVSGSEPILRLVPDLFAKYYKCIELTKQWWVLAHEAFPDVHFKRRPSDADIDLDLSQASSSGADNDSVLSDRNEATNEEIEATKVRIIDNQKVINSLHEELDALDKREEKFEILKETFEQVGRDIENKKKEQKRLRITRDQLNADEGKETLIKIAENLLVLDNSLRLLEFQHALLLEDFLIHMEIRPSIIRFQDDAKMHLKDANTTREKHFSHLNKLRDAFNSSPNKGRESYSPPRKNVTPTIVHSSPSPGNHRVTAITLPGDIQKTKEERKSTQNNTSSAVPVEKGKVLKNQTRRNSNGQINKAPNPTETKQATVVPKMEIQKTKENEKVKTATSEQVETKENIKSQALKRTNSKQNVQPIAVPKNANHKTVSKPTSEEKPKATESENLMRKTYDVSEPRTSKPKQKEDGASQKVEKNGHPKKKPVTIPTSQVPGNHRSSHQCGSHQHQHHPHHHDHHNHCHVHKTNPNPNTKSSSDTNPNPKSKAAVPSSTGVGMAKQGGTKKGEATATGQKQDTTAKKPSFAINNTHRARSKPMTGT